MNTAQHDGSASRQAQFLLLSSNVCQKTKSQSQMAQKRTSMKTNLITAESAAYDPDDDAAADGGG